MNATLPLITLAEVEEYLLGNQTLVVVIALNGVFIAEPFPLGAPSSFDIGMRFRFQVAEADAKVIRRSWTAKRVN